MYDETTQHGDTPVGAFGQLALGTAGLLALLSASCCVLPIGLSILGLGGTWLILLGVFVAWRIPILVVVGGIVFWSWLRLLRRPACGSRRRAAIFLAGLATLAFIIATSAPLWERDAVRVMWSYWTSTS